MYIKHTDTHILTEASHSRPSHIWHKSHPGHVAWLRPDERARKSVHLSGFGLLLVRKMTQVGSLFPSVQRWMRTHVTARNVFRFVVFFFVILFLS